MKIGVISDTHGHEQRFALAVEKFFGDADVIMHAGDVLYHGPRNPMLADYNPAKLAERINACSAQVIIARGNCDSDVDQLVLNSPIQAPYAYAFVNGRRIVMTHGTHFTYCNDPSKPDWSKMIGEIAKAHGKTPGQVVLRWNLQRGVVIIPKSTHIERIRENFDLWDFTLSDEEMERISSLDMGYGDARTKHFDPEFVRMCVQRKIHD